MIDLNENQSHIAKAMKHIQSAIRFGVSNNGTLSDDRKHTHKRNARPYETDPKHRRVETVQDAVKKCISLFNSEKATDEERSAAKFVLHTIQGMFKFNLNISNYLVRKCTHLFLGKYAKLERGAYIKLIDSHSNYLKNFDSLKGLDRYIKIRAKCTHPGSDTDSNAESDAESDADADSDTDEIDVVLQYKCEDKSWTDMDITFTYEKGFLLLASLFFDTKKPPDRFRRAIQEWSQNKSVGDVAVKIAIMLQEQCNIEELRVCDSAIKIFKVGGKKLTMMHNLYAITYNRRLLYLDNGFEPTGNEGRDTAHTYKARAAQFLKRPTSSLFQIPPQPHKKSDLYQIHNLTFKPEILQRLSHDLTICKMDH